MTLIVLIIIEIACGNSIEKAFTKVIWHRIFAFRKIFPQILVTGQLGSGHISVAQGVEHCFRFVFIRKTPAFRTSILSTLPGVQLPVCLDIGLTIIRIEYLYLFNGVALGIFV